MATVIALAIMTDRRGSGRPYRPGVRQDNPNTTYRAQGTLNCINSMGGWKRSFADHAIVAEGDIQSEVTRREFRRGQKSAKYRLHYLFKTQRPLINDFSLSIQACSAVCKPCEF